ncbi:hypothetical protein PAPHI01_0383 [Pancytospora philotis]|nr:hypothetical protein PAPHI01_0357 [Pancytospora philotis]KAI4291109.1 hypothetical protein PAPHI01_0383 [Pancytospora philotis]
MHREHAKMLSICLCKLTDIPARYYNPVDPQADYCFYRPAYTAIPSVVFYLLCLAADAAVAWKLRSRTYFLYSAFCPLDYSSIENWLYVHAQTDQRAGKLGTAVSRAIAPLLPSSAIKTLEAIYSSLVQPLLEQLPLLTRYRFLFDQPEHNHLPSLSGFWYYHMCVPRQFQAFAAGVIALMGISFVSQHACLLPLFCARSTFRSYLLHCHSSDWLTLYLVIALGLGYWCHLFSTVGVINTNFLYWASFAFIAVYLADLKAGPLSRRCNK